MSEVTQILAAIGRGDRRTAEQLLPLVYDELRKLAAARLAHEKPGQTLQATALVHEAYLRLVGNQGTREPGVESRESEVEKAVPSPRPPPASFDGCGHFFAAAAEAMRRILVENARRKQRIKHGGGIERIDLDPAEFAVSHDLPDEQLLALDEALAQLAVEDPLAARVVELRYFAGLGHEEIAAILEISIYLTRQKWTYARAWLREAIGRE